MFFTVLLHNQKEDQTAASVLQFKDQVHNSVIVGDRTTYWAYLLKVQDFRFFF